MPAPSAARESCGDTDWEVQGGAGQQAPTQQAQSSKLPRTKCTPAVPTGVGIMDLFEGLPTVEDEQQGAGVTGPAAHKSTWQPNTTLDNLGTARTSPAQPQTITDVGQQDVQHNRAVSAWVEPAPVPGQTLPPAHQTLLEATTSNAPWTSHISAPEPVLPVLTKEAKRRNQRAIREWLPIQVYSASPDPLPQVNNHTLLRPLCHGGFATVYEARDNETGELCAFKLSTQPLLQLAEDQDVELLDCPKFQDDLHNNNWHYRCFNKEVKTYKDLCCDRNHALKLGLPCLMDCGLTLLPGKNVHSFLAMTLLGQSVYSEICTGRTREPGNFKRLAGAMLSALEHMHTHSYVHRDVKPGNFCLTTPALGSPEPAAFILDFGFAKRYQRDPANWKETEAFEGTPDYASVRSLRSKRQGPCDDLESLAYAMLEMMTGTLPWDVTNPKTWPPEALDRLELRKRKKAGGDGEEAEHSLRAADMEWSDHNLEIMADLRANANKHYAATGFIPKPLVEWIQYVHTLEPWDLPVYGYLHRLVDECAAWQRKHWPHVEAQLMAQGLAVPSLTYKPPAHLGYSVEPLSGCVSGGSYGVGPSDAESWYTAGSKRPRGSSCGDRGRYQEEEDECDQEEGHEDEEGHLMEPAHLIWSEEQPGPGKKLCVDLKDSRLYAREE